MDPRNTFWSSTYLRPWKPLIAPPRLAAAKEACLAFAERVAHCEPHARVAVVAYGGTATMMCPLTPATDLLSIQASIDRMQVINATNITAGLQVADELLESQNPAQVVILSDGHHNMGEGPTRIAHVLRQKATLESVGIAGSPRAVDPLLKQIARHRIDSTAALNSSSSRVIASMRFSTSSIDGAPSSSDSVSLI